jgi:hypothetical protein
VIIDEQEEILVASGRRRRDRAAQVRVHRLEYFFSTELCGLGKRQLQLLAGEAGLAELLKPARVITLKSS